jgi:hypothetical protein
LSGKSRAEGKRPESGVNKYYLYNLLVCFELQISPVIDLRRAPGRIVEGPLASGVKADCTVTLDDCDMVDLVGCLLLSQFIVGYDRFRGVKA